RGPRPHPQAVRARAGRIPHLIRASSTPTPTHTTPVIGRLRARHVNIADRLDEPDGRAKSARYGLPPCGTRNSFLFRKARTLDRIHIGPSGIAVQASRANRPYG